MVPEDTPIHRHASGSCQASGVSGGSGLGIQGELFHSGGDNGDVGRFATGDETVSRVSGGAVLMGAKSRFRSGGLSRFFVLTHHGWC